MPFGGREPGALYPETFFSGPSIMIRRRRTWLLFAMAVLLAIPAVAPLAATEGSQCLSCHSNAGQLLRITQELAKSRPPAVSAVSEGEG
jgi:hypothetical protein